MKDAFHSSGFKLLATVMAVMFCLMLYTSRPGSGTSLGKIFGFVLTPMQRISTIVTNNAAVATNTAGKSKDQLEAENEKLQQQVNDLNKKLVNYYSYQQENAQLRKFLELKNNNPDFKPVAAAVVGRDPNDLFGQFTLDQGSQNGVKKNDPVVTEAGVVGWVSAVSPNYSRVTTILSPETKVSAADKINRETGIIGSDIQTADQNTLKLQYLSAETKVKAGDLVVTSGIGGVYPRNLIVGTVKSVKHSQYDVSLYAEVQPAVSVKDVHDVMVITSFLGQGEEMEAALSSPSTQPSSSGSR